MSTARTRFVALTLGLLVATPAAWAQGGLRLADATRPQETAWPRWQARLGLATTASAIDPGTLWHASAGQLLGDYYWSGLRPAGASLSGGFRATGGLLLGQRSLALGTPTLSASQGVGLTLSRIARPSTGLGEVIIRLTLTRRLRDLLDRGQAPASALDACLAEVVRLHGEAGLILVTPSGQLAWARTTARMPVGWVDVRGASGADFAGPPTGLRPGR